MHDALAQRFVRQEVDLLLGEVDRGFDMQPQFHELLGKRIDGFREIARQRAERSACRLRGARIDQVDDRFCLHQVELVVEKRTA